MRWMGFLAGVLAVSSAGAQSFFSVDHERDVLLRLGPDGSVTDVGALGTDVSGAASLTFIGDGRLIMLNRNPTGGSTLWEVDTASGQATMLSDATSDLGGVPSEGIAWDPVRDRLVVSVATRGCSGCNAANADTLFASTTAGALTSLAAFPSGSTLDTSDFDRLAYRPDGTLFGLDIQGNAPAQLVGFYRIDLDAGQITATTEVPQADLGGGARGLTFVDNEAYTVSTVLARFAVDPSGGFTLVSTVPLVPEVLTAGLAAIPCPADLAAPFGDLTFADITAFLTAFTTQDPAADLAEPVGQFTFADLSAFLAAFSAGCP